MKVTDKYNQSFIKSKELPKKEDTITIFTSGHEETPVHQSEDMILIFGSENGHEETPVHQSDDTMLIFTSEKEEAPAKKKIKLKSEGIAPFYMVSPDEGFTLWGEAPTIPTDKIKADLQQLAGIGSKEKVTESPLDLTTPQNSFKSIKDTIIKGDVELFEQCLDAEALTNLQFEFGNVAEGVKGLMGLLGDYFSKHDVQLGNIRPQSSNRGLKVTYSYFEDGKESKPHENFTFRNSGNEWKLYKVS